MTPARSPKPRLRVGLVYDARDDYRADGFSEEQVAEFDLRDTIDLLAAAIRRSSCTVEYIGNARALNRKLVSGARWDLVFNIAEGVTGRSREAQVPCLLELYGIPYTFSDPLTCAVTLDKAVAKRIVRDAGHATAPFAVVRTPADVRTVRLAYPLFAKPIAEGTGKGITQASRIDAPAELARTCRALMRRYHQPVLVEQFLSGREFTVGIIGTGAAARVIGTLEIEIIARNNRAIYSYETKEKCESQCRYSTPPAGRLRRAVEALALACYRTLECRDGGRVDIRLDGTGAPHFLEVNPLPGIHPTHSDLPMIATRAGMQYHELIGAIITSALQRAPVPGTA